MTTVLMFVVAMAIVAGMVWVMMRMERRHRQMIERKREAWRAGGSVGPEPGQCGGGGGTVELRRTWWTVKPALHDANGRRRLIRVTPTWASSSPDAQTASTAVAGWESPRSRAPAVAGSAATVASSAVAGSAATVASAGVVSSAARHSPVPPWPDRSPQPAAPLSPEVLSPRCHSRSLGASGCVACAPLQALYRLPGLRRLHKLRRACGVLQLLGLALCRRAPRRARLSQPAPEARMRRNQPVSESIRPPVAAPDSTVARTEDPAAASTWQVDQLGEPLHPDAITSRWEKLLKDLQASRPCGCTTPRHSCATLMHLRGVPIAVIAASLPTCVGRRSRWRPTRTSQGRRIEGGGERFRRLGEDS